MLILCYNISILKKGGPLMTDHVSQKTLSEWEERFGDKIRQAIELGHELFAQFESGDSLDVYIMFKPDNSSGKLWVEYTAPNAMMNARIQFSTI